MGGDGGGSIGSGDCGVSGNVRGIDISRSSGVHNDCDGGYYCVCHNEGSRSKFYAVGSSSKSREAGAKSEVL